MSAHCSPFTKRLARFMGVSGAKAIDAQKAFVAALREEVEARFGPLVGAGATDPLSNKPLVIVGLGSFKMRTRPAREFWGPGNETASGTRKPPARRLAFTAKWEPIP